MSKRNLKKYTTKAMKLEEGAVPEAVFLPPAIRGKMVHAQYVTDGKPVDIKQHVIRIQDECDPVGLLIAIANGQPVATFTVDEDGETCAAFETLPLKDRITVIKFLSDKVLPRMSVFKKVDAKKGDAGWEATLTNAGEREDG
jgi:hypothetical protein